MTSNSSETKNTNIKQFQGIIKTLVAFGGVLALFKAGQLAYRIYPSLLPNSVLLNLPNRYGKNSWAVVTGASDGIGKSFVKTLARLEFNIVLIARNENKLKTLVETELKAEFPQREFKTIVIDFQTGNELKIYNDIEKQVKELDVSILVNNVGRTAVGSLIDSKEEDLLQTMMINCFPAVLLTKRLIKNFKNREKKAAVINVSSLVGLHPAPYLATYAGTKSFLNIFTESLGYEEHRNTDFLSLCPYYVSTKMTHYQKLQFDTISTEECVSSGLKNLYQNRRKTAGHWKHELIDFALEHLPSMVLRYRAQRFREKAEKAMRLEEVLQKRNARKRLNKD